MSLGPMPIRIGLCVRPLDAVLRDHSEKRRGICAQTEVDVGMRQLLEPLVHVASGHALADESQHRSQE